MNYIVNLPQGTEITLGLPYGSATFKHGQIVPEGMLTRSYPQYFSPIPDPVVQVDTTPNVSDIIAKIKASINKESTNEVNNETPKKKAGRPKKVGFAKG